MITLDQGGCRQVDASVITPPSALAEVVEHGFVLDMRHVSAPSWLVVPDASAHLLVHLGGGADEPTWAQASLIGARAVGEAFPITGRAWTVGVRLRPGALVALGARVENVPVGHRVSLVDVWGSPGEDVRRRLEGTPDRADILRLAFAFLSDRMRAGTDRPWAVRGFERAARGRGGRRVIEESARSMGISPRTLRRSFTAVTGITPMRHVRIGRLHRAAGMISTGACSGGARVAQRAGYADQAHMSREFTALIGESPSKYRARGLADSFKR